MNNPRGGRQKGQVLRWIQIAAFGALFAICLTWIGSIYDHPTDDSIVTGMASPECASVRAVSAGSILSASQPDSDICVSFFLYRTTHPGAAGNADSYVASIMQERVAEFWQLIGYVLLLWLVTFIMVGGAVWVVRSFIRRHRRHTSRPVHR